jgi:L-lactate dehydrogenase complex protein LldG
LTIMTSRNDILGRLRRRLPMSTPLPDLTGPWQTFDDPHAHFAQVLAGVGGQCHVVPNAQAADEMLRSLPVWQEAKKTASCVLGVGRTNFDLAGVDDPHELEDIDVAVLPGSIAVAENAAIWVNDAQVPHRVLYFLSQHLVLVVPAKNMVHTLHEAYERVDVTTRPFGCWVSGPSKTADIEQSLVIGAHGARSLNVILVEYLP